MALALGGTVVPVIDEGPARRHATERGLPLTRTLALLVSLHWGGLASRTVEEDVALLHESKWQMRGGLGPVVVEIQSNDIGCCCS